MMEREGQLILNIDGLVSGYGKMEILHGISLSVRRGEIVGLIGPNGAGKSTVLKAAAGLLKVISGKVVFRDEDVTHTPPHQIVEKGMAFNPQGRVVFPDMTVQEHLDMGAWTIKDRLEKEKALERIYKLFPWLMERKKRKASQMSGGEQQMLSLARALMIQPKLLLLDEPSLGLSPKWVKTVFEKIVEIKESGIPCLIVEQKAAMVLGYSDYGYVLEMGNNRFEGRGQDLLQNPDVRRLYLGG
ncbi:MAG: ABC transporter ATP-binding protein [Thermodesulfobacteriota bacterium]|nr:ABC transporter ATP-binding protein [Thermodesulfobacteriota bacterium]